VQTLCKKDFPVLSPLPAEAANSASQLPVSSYFDPALYAQEMQSIFQNGPRYVGHALSVPRHGDYCALPQEGEGRALVRNAAGIELVSNVCRHRQAVMLKGRGSLTDSAQAGGGNIVCL
jgi:choline monooxygenase